MILVPTLAEFEICYNLLAAVRITYLEAIGAGFKNVGFSFMAWMLRLGTFAAAIRAAGVNIPYLEAATIINGTAILTGAGTYWTNLDRSSSNL